MKVYRTSTHQLSLYILLTFYIFLRLSWVVYCFPGFASTAGDFKVLSYIGSTTTSNDDPVQFLSDPRGYLYILGNTRPLSRRGGESDLGTAESTNLGVEDMFLTRMNRTTGSIFWTFRFGTDKEDQAHTIAMNPEGTLIYVGGRSYGQLDEQDRRGLTDGFVMKFDVTLGKEKLPRRIWRSPVVFGTAGADAVSKIELDGTSRFLFVTGLSGGVMFEDKNLGKGDLFLAKVDTRTGRVIRGRQFGTSERDLAKELLIASKNGNVVDDGPIYVGSIVERNIGQYKIGNFQLYKFTQDLEDLGSLTVKTFADEKLTTVLSSSNFTNTLYVNGYSWLDQYAKNDIYLKKLKLGFDKSPMGTLEKLQDEISNPEYVARIGSQDNGDDISAAIEFDKRTNKLVMAGNTGGSFTGDAVNNAPIAPFIAVFDPNNGKLLHSSQVNLYRSSSWIELSDVIVDNYEGDGNYLFLSRQINETTQQFFTVVGNFLVPESWKAPIVPVSDEESRPTPSASPGATSESSASEGTNKKVAEEAEGLPLAIIFGAAGGGLVLILAIILICICMKYKEKQRRTKTLQRHKSRIIKEEKESKRKKKKGPRRPPAAARIPEAPEKPMYFMDLPPGTKYAGRLV